MTEQAGNKALVRAHFDAIWGGDDEAIRRQLADGFVDHAGTPGVGEGKDGVVEWARRMRAVFPDMTVTIDRAVAEGEMVAIHATWRGTQQGPFMGLAPSHRAITFSGMVFWRITGGQIAERWAHLDMATAMKQMQGAS